jgi:hypothetical protein
VAVVIAERSADGEVDGDEQRVAEKTALRITGGLTGRALVDATDGLELMAYAASAATHCSRSVRAFRPDHMAHFAALASGDRVKEQAAQCVLLRDIVGSPFRRVAIAPYGLTADVMKLADAAYACWDWELFLVLSDTLEAAGCQDPQILGHARGGGHVRQEATAVP